LHHRFVVGGYVRKRVTLRISKRLRAVALAVGISWRVYSDTRVIFITIIAIYIALAEKIGTPLITIDTWEDMKLEMQTHFVPDHYNRDLFNKLQKLTQGTKFVEE
jgi:hypothetical protein